MRMKCLMVVYKDNEQEEENYMQAELIVRHMEEGIVNTYDGIFVNAGALSAEIAGRLSARAGRMCLTNVCRAEWTAEGVTAYKAVYNYNMEAAFLLHKPFVAACSEKWKTNTGLHLDIHEVMLKQEKQPEYAGSRRKVQEYFKKKASKILLAAGKGIRTKEDIERLRQIAVQRGFDFGVTRPVAMNGWAGIDEIVGVSGHIYAPKICIAVGVSGSSAFFAGIENSEWIASVNTDAGAPIVKMSDVNMVGDYREIWKRLEALY